MNVKNKFLTLNPMQKQFPSVGSYFRIGALPPAVAQIFIRSVSTKTEVRLPLYCPGLEEFAGDSPPSSLLPDNWVFGGELAQRIYEDVMSMDARSLMDSCRDMFNKHENCPVLFKQPDHPGFKELIRVQGNSFHEDPCRLWDGSLCRMGSASCKGNCREAVSLKLVHQQLGRQPFRPSQQRKSRSFQNRTKGVSGCLGSRST